MANTIIDIGTKINLEDLIESRMLIQANSGGGKSGIARVMMEESFGKVPFIVLDKKGEYYTLKEKFADIIIIGGRNADIPISMQAAPLLAKFILKNRLTVIIDLSSLEDDNQRALFLRDFLKGMMNLGEDYWTNYLVFLEEAHVFCGQQDKMPSGKYVKLMMSEGRKMGICGILMTQRISKLHKDAAAECNNKFIGRTFLDLDINRSAAEMGLVGQDKFKLRDLRPQHFWAFGTSIEPHHVHEVVIKDAQTKFVKAGAKFELTAKKPTEKIKTALLKLNELPQEAAKELKTMQDLQKEVNRLALELKNALKQTKPGVSLPAAKDANQVSKIETMNQQLQIRNGELVSQLKQKDIQLVQYKKLYTSACKALDNVISIAQKISEQQPATVSSMPENGSQNHKVVSQSPPIVPRKQVIVSSGDGTSDESLTPGEKIILRACAQYPNGLMRTQITVLSGYARSTRNKYLQYLQAKGFVTQQGEKVMATEDGINALGDFEPLPSGQDLQQYWLNQLSEGESNILKVLIDEHPEYVQRDTISDRTGYARSTRNKYLQYMKAKEIIQTSGDGVKASDDLFD